VTPADNPTAKVRRVYEQMARRYDKDIQFWERLQFAGGREWVTSRARGRVLEVAVGTGRNLPLYPPGVTITGVELSPAMLALARRRAADHGVEADLREADAQALPFDDASFDTAVCTLSLCTIPGPAATIAEMRRVLRPGGLLLLLDHIGSNWWPIWAVQWLAEQVTARGAGEYQTRRQLPLVRAAGFEILETMRNKAGTVERIAARKAPAAHGADR
jgi:ubiquinone/menaquinone biosynthesis C-methylase UbiE